MAGGCCKTGIRRTPNPLLSSPPTLTRMNFCESLDILSPSCWKVSFSLLQAPHQGWLKRYMIGLVLWLRSKACSTPHIGSHVRIWYKMVLPGHRIVCKAAAIRLRPRGVLITRKSITWSSAGVCQLKLLFQPFDGSAEAARHKPARPTENASTHFIMVSKQQALARRQSGAPLHPGQCDISDTAHQGWARWACPPALF